MKRCPTCNSTYTNDALRFCLQDGADLLSVNDAPYPSDPHRSGSEETLAISSASPATEIIDPRAAQTIKNPIALPTAVTQRFGRRSTHEEGDTRGTPQRSTSIPLVAGITAIIVLLLIGVGVGIALLIQRGKEDGNKNAAAATTNENAKNDRQPGTASPNSNTGERSRRPDMTGEFSPAAARAETKVLSGVSVSASDIAGLPRAELRRLRNTVYARHGRIFERMELQQYFDGRPWYKKRDAYTDADLTPIDRDNINLIRAAEDRSM
ncbi:MAG: YARHG domain-containing protein [Acidobacteria bacterium]|nr:YARHG domain-containing protein [Acidobacteriota bacterium]